MVWQVSPATEGLACLVVLVPGTGGISDKLHPLPDPIQESIISGGIHSTKSPLRCPWRRSYKLAVVAFLGHRLPRLPHTRS